MFITEMFLNEGLSPILYHGTSITNIDKILKQNRIRTTPDIGTKAEIDQRKQKHKIYYVSTTRSKVGVYHLTDKYSKQAGLIVLDGRKLMADGYSGNPMDYWGEDFRRLGKNEMEDRIFTDKPYIPDATKYIKEIHILFTMSKGDDHYAILVKEIRHIAIMAKKYGIPVYVYTRPEDFNVQNKAKAISPSELARGNVLPKPLPDAKGETEHSWKQFEPTNYFSPWMELIYKNDYDQLSSDAMRKLRSMRSIDGPRILAADIHNSKNDRGRKHLDKFLAALKKINVHSIEEFFDYLSKKFT